MQGILALLPSLGKPSVDSFTSEIMIMFEVQNGIQGDQIRVNGFYSLQTKLSRTMEGENPRRSKGEQTRREQQSEGLDVPRSYDKKSSSSNLSELFMARHKIQSLPYEEFEEYLSQRHGQLAPQNYGGLLQIVEKHRDGQLIDYLRLFHRFYNDVVFCVIEKEVTNRKVSVLEHILLNQKVWELEQLLAIDQRVLKEFSLRSVNQSIDNAVANKDEKNACQLIEILLERRPDIIFENPRSEESNPLLASMKKELYQVCLLLLEHDCFLLPEEQFSENELHHLVAVGSRTAKRHREAILKVAQKLVDRKVSLSQKNSEGSSVIECCHAELKPGIEHLARQMLPSKRTQAFEVASSNIAYVARKEREWGDLSEKNHDRHHEKYQEKHDKYHEKYHEKHHDKKTGNNDGYKPKRLPSESQDYESPKSPITKYQEKQTKKTHKNLAQNSATCAKGATENSKDRSDFGGRNMIKDNSNFLKTSVEFKDDSGIRQEGDSAKYSTKGIELSELDKEAAKVFARRTQEKQEKAEQQPKRKAKSSFNRNKIMSSNELRHYLRKDIEHLTGKIKAMQKETEDFFNPFIDRLRKAIEDELPVKVEIFGSFATGLHLEESDIDIVVCPQEHCEFSSMHLLQSAHEKLLEMTEEIESSTFLDKASVPIVKATCTERYKKKNIDISYKDKFHNGLRSVELVSSYMQLYPELLNLILVLKKFIYEAQLVAPYSGGLSSYGLILMIVAFIQQKVYGKPENSADFKGPENANSRSSHLSEASSRHVEGYPLREPEKKLEEREDCALRTAELLIGFLKFYGFKVDYIIHGIAAIHPQHILEPSGNFQRFKNSIIFNAEPVYDAQMQQLQQKLVLIDPLLNENNVGKSARRIKEMKMAFELAYIAIHTNRTCKRGKKCEVYCRIAQLHDLDVVYLENRRPCCILERMFRCVKGFDLTIY